jgi:hypothetical protein
MDIELEDYQDGYLRQLKQKDLKALKEKWYNEQNGICPLFCQKYPIEEVTLDHSHAIKSDKLGENGKGLCRGVIHFQANSIEGKITNAFKRYGGDKHIDIISYLRNLANYLEHNKIHSDEKYIHPSEEPKAPKLMKSSYNKLLKVVGDKQKVPEYNGKFTKPIQKLFEKYGIIPTFHESNKEKKT